MDVKEHRKIENNVDEIFVNRWSARAMSGEKVSKKELMSLFEAARWAPSSSNEQPWRFVYVLKESKNWKKFFDFVVPGNQAWIEKAGALIVVISRKNWKEDGSFNPTHSFDTGAAWENFALEGSLKELVVHGMAGFDYDKAKEMLKVSDEYKVEMMIGVGKPGKLADLPEKYRAREKPNGRNPLSEMVFEEEFVN
ncbi:MAG: nitroreductase family protein [Nanoarchaeota archaeon]|nr:nitroreductase family protein [Nanoarchaeota archaeon]